MAVQPSEIRVYHEKWAHHAELDLTNDSVVWAQKKKHVFIFTDAGKPVFSRYGDEIKLAPFMGTLTALSSVVEDTTDNPDTVMCDNRIIVFHTIGPIHVVVIASTGETPRQLRFQAEMLGRKLCSIIPYHTILQLFKEKTSYDFRRLVVSEYDQIKFTIHSFNTQFSAAFDAVSICPSADRERFAEVYTRAIASANEDLVQTQDTVVFALLIRGFQALYIYQRNGCVLTPADFFILCAFVAALPNQNDKWVPIGLNDFNRRRRPALTRRVRPALHPRPLV